MNRYLSRLNPTERRFVIGVGLLLFIVINIFWIRPHFSDWGNLKGRLNASKAKLSSYEMLIQRIPALQTELRKFGGEGDVPPEDQLIHLQQTIQSQGFASGVSFSLPTRASTITNQSIIEVSQGVSISGGEKQVVDFLFNLGAAGSIIRAKAMSIRPEPNHYQLNANMTLIATFQKKPPAPPPRTTPAATTPKAAAVKSAVTNKPPTVTRTTIKTSAPPAGVGLKGLQPPPAPKK